MDIIKKFHTPPIEINSMLQYETDKSGVYYQSIKNKSYNEYGKMDWGLANRIEELPRNDWGMIHGTQGQSFAYEPIILQKPNMMNELYNIQTPHFLNKLENRVINVSGFEYTAKDIPMINQKPKAREGIYF